MTGMGFVGNYLRNLGAIAIGRTPAAPLMFSWYVTHRCGLNCAYCCDGDGKRFAEERIPELTTAEARQLIDRLAAATDTLDLTGGEPLLRPDLEDLLAHARQRGMRTVLNTKGIGLADRPDLWRFTDVLVLSLDTLDPGRLASLIGRDRATAQAVLDGLTCALAQRGRPLPDEGKGETAVAGPPSLVGLLRRRPGRRARRHGPLLVLSVVATPTNLDDLAAVLALAQRERLGFQISPEIVGTHPNPALRGHLGYRALLRRVRAAKAAGAGVLGVEAYLRGIRDFRRFHCHPLLMPVIRPDGRLYYPCLESKNATVNLLDHRTYGEALAAARRLTPRRPTCGDCCHIFCHMALSLLQRHPLQAARELRLWRHLDA
ncbi:MAG: Radical SAM domain heme biosynthesis protein [Candidatus Ozemobacter sibiricus]|jgi:MoaA/NifB/PqqE/SkfB family radical SAM enzyme|uniref:Radical SAM domain heme biosynthesis protein n=1 Tax=Candidatus Ozemobacter sibiricus TaxID=2268124 RepID=A0A367ZSL9_9BACT|nr:MAG: Radical SAM domain heme biosynthesis protein [Candidatus Ozemobacter sibiricus]